MTRRSLMLLAASALALSILACNMPTPTSGAPPDTVTAYAPPTVPSGDGPTAVPTTGSPTSPVGSTEPPSSAWLPAGTLALYTSGTWSSAQLYALAPGPTSVDLGLTVPFQTRISRTGRWIAYASGAPATVIARSLESGTAHTFPLTPSFTFYGSAFDQAESRLAFMELGGSGASTYTWAIVVVNLADGSTTRFEATFTPPLDPGEMLPGKPIGWSAPGGELLLDTFLPDTEGSWAGVWAVTLPPGTPSATFDSLGRRELLSVGDYRSDPHLSPAATHLLYLHRAAGYTPAGYAPEGYDLAVNQLWQVDVASGMRALLVDASDGSALARDAAWSQEVPHTLFAQGNYAGAAFGSLALKTRDDDGTISNAGSVPLPAGGGLIGIDWCLPDFALVTVVNAAYDAKLHMVEFGGSSTLVACAESISVLGCIP
jgi:hypothetical protein